MACTKNHPIKIPCRTNSTHELFKRHEQESGEGVVGAGRGEGSRVAVPNKMFSLKIFALTPAAAAAEAAEAKAPKAAASYWP